MGDCWSGVGVTEGEGNGRGTDEIISWKDFMVESTSAREET